MGLFNWALYARNGPLTASGNGGSRAQLLHIDRQRGEFCAQTTDATASRLFGPVVPALQVFFGFQILRIWGSLGSRSFRSRGIGAHGLGGVGSGFAA